METKLISLIVVTYQAEKHIEATLQNLIQQEYPSKEIIVIDGKSKDNTVAIISKYLTNISYFISEPDKGLYDAMNKGMAVAKGEYLLFINAGDLLHNEHALSQCMQKCNTADVIYGDTFLIDENYQLMELRRLRPPSQLRYKDFMHGMLVSHQAFMVKRSLSPRYNLGYRYSADFDWCVSILKKSQSNCNTGIIMSRFMVGGQTSRTMIPGLKERFRIMQKHYGLFNTILSHIYILSRYLYQLASKKKTN